MSRKTGGYAVVKSFESQGVDTVFGQPGSHTLEIYDALRESRSIRHINVRDEGNAAVMADVYGRLIGRPGVCLTTAGPGATNCVTAIAQAHAARSPVVHVSGHCETTSILPFHGLYRDEFLLDIFKPVTKRSFLVREANAIENVLQEAFSLCNTGKKGPVHIEIPRDVLGVETAWRGLERKELSTPEFEPQSTSEVLEMLVRAQKPIILAGQGVIRHFASAELMDLAERLSAPVMTPWNARSLIPFDHPMSLGYPVSGSIGHFIHPLFMEIIKDSDMILMIGSDVGEALYNFLKGHERVILIDQGYDEELLGKIRFSHCLDGDIKKGLKFIGSKLKHFEAGKAAKERAAKALEAKQATEKEASAFLSRQQDPHHLGKVIAELAKTIEDKAIVTSDTGIIDSWLYSHLPCKGNRFFLTAGRFGSMGFALPGAIGAKICFPERPVVALCGDGSFLMSMADFGTAVENHLDMVFVILNDKKFGSIGKMQELEYDGRYFSIDIQTPDFVQYAASFGANGLEVEKVSDIQKAFKEARALRGPVIISVACDSQVPLFSL
jgi:acetolactate synthase-1/2/3 large subunit